MKYDVTFTEQAENDLRGIFEYIALIRVMYSGRDVDKQLDEFTKL